MCKESSEMKTKRIRRFIYKQIFHVARAFDKITNITQCESNNDAAS